LDQSVTLLVEVGQDLCLELAAESPTESPVWPLERWTAAITAATTATAAASQTEIETGLRGYDELGMTWDLSVVELSLKGQVR
jgi:hypothetical protein